MTIIKDIFGLKKAEGENYEEILKKTKDLSEANLREANLSGADLSGANLREADLRGADLRGADLSGADLRGADLSGANLRVADLRVADLRGADLRGADLSEADLREADLRGADLSEANLSGADLREADLSEVLYNASTSFFALQCPEVGDFVGWKKANGCVVKLRITDKSKRSSATTRKCRCSEAIVLDITDRIGNQIERVASSRDKNFIYEVGKIVKVDDFDDDRWSECTKGIHFFLTRQEAENYE